MDVAFNKILVNLVRPFVSRVLGYRGFVSDS
jgi:hypothetical protein